KSAIHFSSTVLGLTTVRNKARFPEYLVRLQRKKMGNRQKGKGDQMEQCSQAVPSIVITGGASGIGAAVARGVVDAGGYVGVIDLNSERARSFALELGDHAIGLQANAADVLSLASAYREFERSLPPVNGLVNCAGAPPVPKPIECQSVDDWERVLASHIKTTYVSCKVIGSAIAARGYGSIVNTASVLAFRS